MLKSTHRPLAVQQPQEQLPAGWTEHKAPSGHSYYYHAETKKSTYTRPINQPEPATQDFISFSEPPNGGTFAAPSFGSFSNGMSGMGFGSISRGDWHEEQRKPKDRPKHVYRISACAPWILVQTRLGRRFVHNVETRESLWKFPEHVMKAVVEWDVERMKTKGEVGAGVKGENTTQKADSGSEGRERSFSAEGVRPQIIKPVTDPQVEDEQASDEEYEEVEVTDDDVSEDDVEREEEKSAKRMRVDDFSDDKPVEFDEDDIAWQLQAMDQDRALYDEGHDMGQDDILNATAGAQLSNEDASALFYDLLDDWNINPFRTWDQVIDEGAIIEDDRYVALPNMRTRRETFDRWSRERIQALREERALEAKKDPRIPYIVFLEKHASPKLYWPEFKRKHRKELEMRDSKVSDKDREKWYREHIKRLQLPESTLKSDLSTLLKAQPLSDLNSSSVVDILPSSLITDLRYISLRAEVRTPLIEAYISTLAPAPKKSTRDDEDGDQRRDRERREKALADREREVQETKWKQEKDLAMGRERLRAETRELERALKINKDGLRTQLEPDANR